MRFAEKSPFRHQVCGQNSVCFPPHVLIKRKVEQVVKSEDGLQHDQHGKCEKTFKRKQSRNGLDVHDCSIFAARWLCIKMGIVGPAEDHNSLKSLFETRDWRVLWSFFLRVVRLSHYRQCGNRDPHEIASTQTAVYKAGEILGSQCKISKLKRRLIQSRRRKIILSKSAQKKFGNAGNVNVF